ncbi:MAG: chitobiase/beta-hexosaminidase C-terminal domain-containing protein [Bacteroidaceae bacterium]|nr:chitobiase/beta-hexosaminidase C-terminal domain-containing protein [Bacteroidaceae bacterium]
MKKFLLSIFAVLFAFAGAQAQSELIYTLEPATGSNNAYASNCDITIDGIKWNLTGNSTMIPWRIGGKNLTKVDRTLYSKTPMEGAVDKVELITGTASSVTVNSAKLLVADNASFANAVEYPFTFKASSTIEIPVSAAPGSYYKFVFNVTIGGSNKYIQFTRAKFYGTTGTPGVETVATPVITAESTTFNEGESLTVTIKTETEGAEIYYTLDGSDPVENGALYEGEIELTETTTVKAVAMLDGWNNSEVAEATFTAIDPKGGTFELVASELGVANGVEVKELTFGNVTATFALGSNSNAPKYYSSGTAIRCYGGNTITFTGAKGVTITGIELTYGSSDGSNAITADCGTFSVNTWTGASNEVVLTVGGTSGNRRIAKIKVTYSVGENVVVIATPSITASTSFVGSTTVEITNNEEGTTLYYSTNGVDYDVYTTALNITETTTVYAKAVDAEGNESAVAEATYTKIEVLSIAEAKAAYDAVSANVDVAVDLTGAVVTVNNGQYLFIENETTGINIYNSGAEYAEGTKFTAGYILGTSTTYRNMHQLSNVEFCGVETTAVTVKPLEVTIADIAGNYDEYEGRFVKLTGVSIDADKNMTQGDDEYKAYDRFTLGFGAIANCDVTGIVAIYNTGEQLYIKDITYNLSVTDAGYATLFLDFNAAIPAGVEAYAVTDVNNGFVTMTQVAGILPANTGVIVKATEDDYTFAYSKETPAAVTGNFLLGTATATEIDVEAYVLGNVDGVGLYKAQMAGGVWLNNANKAYLPASAVPAAAQGAANFSFRFGEGTTGIDEVKGENGNVKTIYDLTGRKVEAITAPGIYIVNGKKVLVK